MADRKLHLVYSSTPSEMADARSDERGFENARQLLLFDSFDKIRIILVPISEISVHSFQNAIREKNPELIIDTRKFPDFFSIFSSMDEAFREFHAKGINYERVPLEFEGREGESWENLGALRRLIGAYFKRKADAPVLLLTSTSKKSEKLAAKVPGYLSQEVAETQLEEFTK